MEKKDKKEERKQEKESIVQQDDRTKKRKQEKESTARQNDNTDKRKKDKVKEATVALEEAALELTIELGDIAGNIDEKKNRNDDDVNSSQTGEEEGGALGIKYLSGKPRKSKPGEKQIRGGGPKKHNHNMKKEKRKVNKQRTKHSKAARLDRQNPPKNPGMRVKLGDRASKTNKDERMRRRHDHLYDGPAPKQTQGDEATMAATTSIAGKGGKARNLRDTITSLSQGA